MKSRVLVLILFSNPLLSSQALHAQSEDSFFAFRNVAVIDVVDGSIDRGMTVVVTGNQIAKVGKIEAVAVPDGATIVDATGKFLIPGLWDMHTHLLWSTDASEHVWTEMPKRVDSWTLWERYYGPTLDLLVASGVTGIREMWGDLEIARRVRGEAAAGERIAPRMVVAGHVIDGPPALWPGLVVVTTPEEAREAVDSLEAAGAAFIKVRYRVRPEEYRVIAQRSRELDVPLAGHVPHLVRAEVASDAGQRSIEHWTGVIEGCTDAESELIELNRGFLDALSAGDRAAADSLEREYFLRLLSTHDTARCRSLLRYLADNETWQTPTLTTARGRPSSDNPANVADPRMKYVHPAFRSAWLPENDPYGERTDEGDRLGRRVYERKMEVTGMAAEEEVPILAGTDTPNAFVFPGFGLHDELELLVATGITPLEALRAATVNPARFLGRAHELGSVEEGKLADLVLLEANPMEDIRNTRRIVAVVLDGRLLGREDLDRLLKGVEREFSDATP